MLGAPSLVESQKSAGTCIPGGTRVEGGLIGASPISHIAVSGDGMLLAHPRDGALTKLDRNLKHPSVIGRRGDGPGEFRWITSIGFAGSQFWIYDGTLRRATVFSSDNNVVRTIDIRSLARRGATDLKLLSINQAGALYGAFATVRAARGRNDYASSAIVKLRADAEARWSIDTIATIRQRPPLMTVAVSANEARSLFVPELSYNDVFAASPDGRWIVWSQHLLDNVARPTRVTVHRLDTRSDALVTFSLPTSIVRRLPPDRAKRRYLRAKFADAVRGDPDQAVDRIVDALMKNSNDHWELVRKLWVNDSGEVWGGIPTMSPGELRWLPLHDSRQSDAPLVTQSEVVALWGGRVLVACNEADEGPELRQAAAASTGGKR